MAEMEEERKALSVRISDDLMHAWARLEPLADGSIPTADEVRRELRNLGVEKGIKEENLKEMLANKRFYMEVEMAEGRPCVDGVDGQFELMLDATASSKPVELPDGSVDYSNVQLFVPVTKGQLLVQYTPATNGSFGYSVTGQLLTPKKGKDLPILKGKGFDLSENGREYYASYDGRIEFKEGNLEVSRVFTVNGDVDTSNSGHIRFAGDVEIKGDVAQGVVIEAGGTVIVSGHVGAATIVAGENVLIKGGMQGDGSGRISAGGYVEASFVEYSNVQCTGDFKANYLLNSYLEAGGIITISGKKGVIAGGYVHGVNGIVSSVLGNQAEIPTTVEVGPGEEINKKLLELRKQLLKVDEEIELLRKGKEQLEAASQQVREKNASMYDKVIIAISQKQTERETYLSQERKLYEIVVKAQKAKVSVGQNVYRGVCVCINQKTMEMKEEQRNVSFMYLDDRITVSLNL